MLKAWQAWVCGASCGAQLRVRGRVSSPRLCARGTHPGRAARGRAAGGPPPGRRQARGARPGQRLGAAGGARLRSAPWGAREGRAAAPLPL